MDESEGRRWRKKRWAAALLVWLVVAYPLSAGPVAYGYSRGWASSLHPAVRSLYTPLHPFMEADGRSVLNRYVEWWSVKGYEAEGYGVVRNPDGTLNFVYPPLRPAIE